MNETGLSPEMLKKAVRIIQKAVDLQQSLHHTVLADQILDRSIPVVWFGRRSPGSLVTIGTNPSSKEFLSSDGRLLPREKSRFFVREEGISLYHYHKDEALLIETVDHYQTYFERNKVYSGWFGKRDGAKLEGFINGLGYSFYQSDILLPAVHIDFFPIPTLIQMGQIKDRESVINTPLIRSLLTDTLCFLSPGTILILGKEHCARFRQFYPDTELTDPLTLDGYPSARYETGYSKTFQAQVIGLHFKPLEQFLALGGGTDRNGLNHGSYGGRDVIRQLGEMIRMSAQEE
ncbi:hypothetical protein [Jeotgalibacillus sp. R-1-5s-1]|uniref:hypothetical protein n=1 Tax=Jeotgalibacillus sp. R-1-5s-1 TaxID=2555897 RepID=UPI00106C0367|nr:hypothetical protein [Jeotgalibacillus sp. R-1-5s-1]TFE00126.1 hypothetical protein E2491_06715 [Jeotgalibacillus sp. R-1-5s-1]